MKFYRLINETWYFDYFLDTLRFSLIIFFKYSGCVFHVSTYAFWAYRKICYGLVL